MADKVYKDKIGQGIAQVTPLATQPDHVPQFGQVQSLVSDEVVTASVSGTYNLDWTKEVFRLTMTADTTFSDINLPTGTVAKLITIYLTGDFIPTFPTYYTVDSDSSDPYVGTVRNRILVDCINGTAASEDVTYEINNL